MLAERYGKEIEDKWRKHWEEQGTYDFDEGDDVRPIYSIDTPPPFTSGELHMGHVLSYSYFDFAARYKRMCGFNVYYPQGWDCQGFPTEVKVEKKFGRLPPAQFREKCVEWTGEFIARMKSQMKELAFSADWRYEYRTMEPEYHRKVQLSLLKMYGDKLVYRQSYPVFWCPKCVSAIAKAELDDVEKQGTLNFIKFNGPDGKDLVIATTRPELLHACVAVLFHPEDGRYRHLEGKRIITPLGKEVLAFADKEVDKEFGTGLVMVCTFGDKMDVVWTHRYKLPVAEAMDRYGKLKNAGEFDGLKAEEAKKKIMEKLEAEGKVVKKQQLSQMVKTHDRCGTAVELILSMQWFADIRSTSKHIKEMAHRIKWIPEFGISYLIDWVEGAEWDWVISRQRVFGTPLPFYYCEKCNATRACDESELPFSPEKAKKHVCGCGEGMKPETSTCDVWVDSSITPLIISGWPDDMEKFKKFYPNSLRPQGVEIVRTWAFYTIYRSGVALTGIPPWKEILLNGNVLAPDGKKMSKSLGNIISPADLLRDYPVDALRQWAAMSGAMAKDRPFSYEDMKYAKSFLTKLWNAARFVENAMKDYEPDRKDAEGMNSVDRWMESRMNETIKAYTDDMERYDYQHAIGGMHRFFWHDFCGNYLEYVKYRVYGEGKGKRAALYTLYNVLLKSIILLAPITPHICEEIYAALFSKNEKNESVTKEHWPEAGRVDAESIKRVEVLNRIVSEIRQHKASNRLPQNAELSKAILTLDTELGEELQEELKSISRIKELEIKKGEFHVSVL
ncbi:valine--tRNA ligase [Candidatus Micrarchaeota archaeon]|nr:valine--tRNA ligase [Candidatus Micrarchaeota archaeon]